MGVEEPAGGTDSPGGAGVEGRPAGPQPPGRRRRSGVVRVLRAAVVVAIVAVVLWVLFTVVFPWVEVLLDDPTLGAGG